ncbi:putative formaldehyde dehydrogenase AdhA [Streptomyces sp. AVP053U2]|nr:putative formaldehyde dehydrogenase AdhA [Streptomyces sp. AVP053U2]
MSAPLDLDAYLSLLRTDGALVNVGAPEQPVSLNLFSVIAGRKTLAGSSIGGIRQTQEMLDFCAAHGIGAEQRRPLPLRDRHGDDPTPGPARLGPARLGQA